MPERPMTCIQGDGKPYPCPVHDRADYRLLEAIRRAMFERAHPPTAQEEARG